jgi:uncharacterized circularly permuted ATP-grasp superfamily protein
MSTLTDIPELPDASDSPQASGQSNPKVPLFSDYRRLGGTYDEFFSDQGNARAVVEQLVRSLDRIGQREFQKRQHLANSAFLNAGVTFSVYSDTQGGERVFPFEQSILAEEVIPRRLVLGSSGYLPKLHGVKPPAGVYVHVAGIDLIRGPDGEFLVLEDNARTPSGVSYVLENRGVMKRALPLIFRKLNVRSVDDYPNVLRSTLCECAPVPDAAVRPVVLTPGPFNSAYFEHSFLARRMGCELAYPSDLFVRDRKVYLKTTSGPEQIHVIYRRIDDDFLDPEFFRPDSMLGVAGLIAAYAAGNVTLANAPGNGVADDKGIYPYVPKMIRFYLSEEPILGQVETYHCDVESDLTFVLANLQNLVVKAVDGSGGYGMLMGPTASAQELEEFEGKLRKNPRGYIAQPRIELSAAPTWCGTHVEPRRLDLRPFVLTGKETWVLPGGLSRVALKPNSYVVNSSQGGGSKDTWVLGGKAS